MTIKIVAIPIFNDNYIWLLIDQTTQQAVCIDPGLAQPVIDYLKQNKLQLSAILITHHHADHIGGVADLIEHTPNVETWGPVETRLPFKYIPVTEKMTISPASFQATFSIIETPGHTRSHLCFYVKTLDALFCGDTLFSAGCGRLFEGTAQQMLNSLDKINSLASKTKLYCAHEYTDANLCFAQSVEPSNEIINAHIRYTKQTPCTLPSTLELERKINPFLRCDSAEIIASIQKVDPLLTGRLAIFTKLRQLKNEF